MSRAIQLVLSRCERLGSFDKILSAHIHALKQLCRDRIRYWG
jgi:hypothetical protein